MFVSDKLVYLELQKTGCTHIRNLFHELLDGELIGEHNQARDDMFREGRKFVGSIRDPWEWYISLWAYGCDHKGAVFHEVTRGVLKLGWRQRPLAAFLRLLHYRSENRKKWLDTYRNVDDPGAFRAWLSMMYDKDFIRDLGEGFYESPLSDIAGLLTYRYLRLFCVTAGQQNSLNQLSTYPQIIEFDRKSCFIDYFIRNESLEEDLFHILENMGAVIPAGKKQEIVTRPRSNVSSRQHGSAYYYDLETEKMVAEREQLIIEKFGYTPG